MTTSEETGSGPTTDQRPGATSPGDQLRRLLVDEAPCVLMGVHDGLSARIAVEEGFRALWASGLCISTALGVRDSDEASWTQLLNSVESMVDNTRVPVLVDGDTGHGNFNTARRFAGRAERIGAAGVCFEDKTFPKMNSFFGVGHELVPVAEFCGKIKACKDGQQDPGFVVVARTESFIAGQGVDEAVARAEAYAAAGADAIFVHSRQPTAVEIAAFSARWHGGVPIVIAPTTYHRTTLDEFHQLGVGGVIWANQSMRAAFSAMRKACRDMRSSGVISGVEEEIASLKEIFALLGYEDLEREERRYASFDPPVLSTVTGGNAP
ncbi:phosphoenolpyruvate mutase [Plantactinospora solaniradicis]|uniref:phosphoenolpyruvate mutase n=1 Tax=Plantactinospora solaniradicis TaxID=1723736 RepID=A0ABW1K412_9ACTN